MIIDGNCVVSIHYTLTGDDGAEIDSSAGNEPLVYLHGAHNIIPGLESALSGKSVGDELDVTVEPEDGYGAIDPALIQKVPRTVFEGVDDIQPGMQFHAENDEGDQRLIVVTSVSGEEIEIDANHPLAGRTLHFKVSVENIRDATSEEVEHGHAH